MRTTGSRLRSLGIVVFACLAPCTACSTASPANPPAVVSASMPQIRLERREMRGPEGRVEMDFYAPSVGGPVPLVVVAHGFWRSRSNMAGWGRHLAAQGYLVAVPDLPAWSDHARNGRAINALAAWLIGNPPAAVAIDASGIALVGFSAGGLATLLAAADNPRVVAWVGLDPVDRGGAGVAAVGRVSARPFIVIAEPSSCNGSGNAAAIAAAFGARVTVSHVPGASHADAEWPTDWKARLFCGGTSDARRDLFVKYATDALTRAFNSR